MLRLLRLSSFESSITDDAEGEEDEGEAEVQVTAEEAAAAQIQWEKTQRRHHRPIQRRTRHPRNHPPPSPTTVPLHSTHSPSPSPVPPAGKDHRASLFACWLVRHYGEQMLRGDTPHAHPTTVSDYQRFSAHTLAAFPRVVDEKRQCSLCSSSLLSSPPALRPPSGSACHHRPRGGGVGKSSPSLCSVVDVAGGRGDLSALLSTVYGISTTVVDPRPLRLERWRLQFRHRCQVMKQRRQDNRTDVTEVPEGR